MFKRKRNMLRVCLLSVTSISVLNFVGLNYAAWNDTLNLDLSVSTGSLNPSFCNQYILDSIRGDSNLQVKFDDADTLNITGVIDTDYKGFLNYCVVNEGTLPAKFTGQPAHLHNGLKLQVNQQAGILEPGEKFFHEPGNPKLHIQADKPGTYEFELELPFDQWNNKHPKPSTDDDQCNSWLKSENGMVKQ